MLHDLRTATLTFTDSSHGYPPYGKQYCGCYFRSNCLKSEHAEWCQYLVKLRCH